MGPYGLYQHANGREANLKEGYCTDDNARAVVVLLAWREQWPTDAVKVEIFLQRCFAYIKDAKHSPGEYYNFRDAQGQWLTHDVSEDMYARLARAYALILTHDHDAARKQAAEELLLDLLPTLAQLRFPRAQAEAIIAITLLPPDWLEQHPTFRAVVAQHLKHLASFWQQYATLKWRWFETAMTYANALLPHSILVGSKLLQTTTYNEILHDSTQFLLQATIEKNIFRPIGSDGWSPKGSTPSHDNQQPIETGLTIDFLLNYTASFPDKVSINQVIAPYLWFYGQNDQNVLLVDYGNSASFDALCTTHVNTNCGAESLLAYLWSEIRINQAPLLIRLQAWQERDTLIST